MGHTRTNNLLFIFIFQANVQGKLYKIYQKKNEALQEVNEGGEEDEKGVERK